MDGITTGFKHFAIRSSVRRSGSEREGRWQRVDAVTKIIVRSHFMESNGGSYGE